MRIITANEAPDGSETASHKSWDCIHLLSGQSVDQLGTQCPQIVHKDHMRPAPTQKGTEERTLCGEDGMFFSSLGVDKKCWKEQWVSGRTSNKAMVVRSAGRRVIESLRIEQSTGGRSRLTISSRGISSCGD